jgi:hypothetical protein
MVWNFIFLNYILGLRLQMLATLYFSYHDEITKSAIVAAGARHVISKIVAYQLSSVLIKRCTKAVIL